MLQKSMFLVVTIHTKKHFRLTFPIPFYVFTELLESFDGWVRIIAGIMRGSVRQVPEGENRPAFPLYELYGAMTEMLVDLQEHGSFTLVDVDTGNEKVCIRFV